MPERSDTQVLAKFECARSQAAATLPGSCGPFRLDRYRAGVSSALAWSTEANRLNVIAGAARTRRDARLSACGNLRTVGFFHDQLARERRVGRIGGYVDAALIHRISSTIEILERQQPRIRAQFKAAWGRAFDRRRDC